MPLTEIYAGEHPRKRETRPAIFLEGPTSRNGQEDWRPEALRWLSRKPYQGIAYIPSPRSGENEEYDEDIFLWRMERIKSPDVVVAIWIPAGSSMSDIAEISTYFGIVAQWKPSRVVFGYPDLNPSVLYLTLVAKTQKIPIRHSVPAMLAEALKLTRR